MNAREKIIAAVKSAEKPSLDDVAQIDAEDYSALRYLIKIFSGKTTDAKYDAPNQSLKFLDGSGTVTLELQKAPTGQWNGIGELANDITTLLAAVRIHEVDSYEWTLFPPEVRQSFVAERARVAGTSSIELKRLMSIWVA